MTAEKKVPTSGARPSWVMDAKPKLVATPPGQPQPGKRSRSRLGFLVVVGAVLLLTTGLLVFLLTRGTNAAQPMDLYLTAKGLLEQGKDLEAAAVLSRARKAASDPRHIGLLAELEKDIEHAPRLKIAAQLVDSRQHPAASQVLREVIKAHPKSERAKTMLAGLEAEQARVEGSLARAAARRSQQAATPSATAVPLVVVPQRRRPPRSASRPGRHAAAAPDPAPAISPVQVPAPQPAQAPRPDHGQVRVETSEPADVFVDGKAAGRAPATLSLPPGVHLIEVRAERDGSLSARRRVMVATGMASTVELRLKKKSIDSNNPYGE